MVLSRFWLAIFVSSIVFVTFSLFVGNSCLMKTEQLVNVAFNAVCKADYFPFLPQISKINTKN